MTLPCSECGGTGYALRRARGHRDGAPKCDACGGTGLDARPARTFNVYRWDRPPLGLARAVRVWVGQAVHAPAAILAAKRADSSLARLYLFARVVGRDPYAGPA